MGFGILRVIQPSAIVRLASRPPAVAGDLRSRSTLRGCLPDFMPACPVRRIVDPFTVSGPAGYHMVAAVRRQLTHVAAIGFHYKDPPLVLQMALKCDEPPIRRPVRHTRVLSKACQLGLVPPVLITDPYFGLPGAVRRKRYVLPIGRILHVVLEARR